MRSVVPFFVLSLALLPIQAWAAGPIISITIKSRTLPQPVVITGAQELDRFHYGRGPGTMPVAGPERSFVIEWAKGTVAAPPADHEVYQLEFLTTRTGKNTYRVSYVYDPVKRQGFVYLPGKEDPHYEENIWLIYRGGIEGNWFQAWSEWDVVFERLMLKQR